jgi:chemotaxis protein methyltransferase CheR
MSTVLISPDLKHADFVAFRDLLYRLCGIHLHDGKEGLVRSRIAKRLRVLGLSSYEAYLAHLEADPKGPELAQFVDVLTTNKTSFFREERHFDFLARHVLPTLVARRRIRIWSAGCSSGEEPATIGIVLRESVPELDRVDARILATDISARVLTRAKEGVYTEEALREVPPRIVQTYFTAARQEAQTSYRLKDSVRGLVRHARLNLMEPWPMKGPFDVIFCRNVMIYFDRQTQERLVGRYHSVLAPGGYLFVGHSESMTSLRHDFEYVSPAIYRKPGGNGD